MWMAIFFQVVFFIFRRYQSDWTVYDLVFIPFSEGFLYLISDVHNVTNYTYTIYR